MTEDPNDDAADSGPAPGSTRALAERVGDRLGGRDETLAVAEAATGGSLGAAITAVPGASDYFRRGVVAYAYDTKRRALGVRRELLDEHGVVSAPVAREMARGIRDAADVTWGVGTTAVAGPTGGTDDRPVGTAFVGVAHAAPWETGNSYATVGRYRFEGDRGVVREAVVRRALLDLLAEVDAVDGTDGED